MPSLEVLELTLLVCPEKGFLSERLVVFLRRLLAGIRTWA